MPITRSKQSWKVGSVVKIGFLGNFLVIKEIPTPGDHEPDKYLVLREKTKKFYHFQPHFGLTYPDIKETVEAFSSYDI